MNTQDSTSVVDRPATTGGHKTRRRLFTALAATLVGAFAFPAAAMADRPVPTEPAGNMSRVTSFCADVCQDLEERIVQVPTGEQILYHFGWAEDEEEDLDTFLYFVDFEVYRNGVLQDVVEPQNRSDPSTDFWGVNYDFVVKPGGVNVPQEWTVRLVVNENDPDFEGFVIEEFTRAIVWTPRVTFPSADYPCSTGQDPCEEAWSFWPDRDLP